MFRTIGVCGRAWVGGSVGDIVGWGIFGWVRNFVEVLEDTMFVDSEIIGQVSDVIVDV